RVKVTEDPAFSKRFPAFLPCRMEITLRDGTRKTATIDYPRGHYKNPLGDDELFAKFRELAARVLEKVQIDDLLEQVMRLEHSDHLEKLFSTLQIKEYAA
ncbi:MAG: hypothetical protein NTW47_09965, partial [Proteobacteria bacterium]|nr:hypothetical protein [Pseudomonadota bacterium]